MYRSLLIASIKVLQTKINWKLYINNRTYFALIFSLNIFTEVYVQTPSYRNRLSFLQCVESIFKNVLGLQKINPLSNFNRPPNQSYFNTYSEAFMNNERCNILCVSKAWQILFLCAKDLHWRQKCVLIFSCSSLICEPFLKIHCEFHSHSKVDTIERWTNPM